jgi:hypothetical protein
VLNSRHLSRFAWISIEGLCLGCCERIGRRCRRRLNGPVAAGPYVARRLYRVEWVGMVAVVVDSCRSAS